MKFRIIVKRDRRFAWLGLPGVKCWRFGVYHDLGTAGPYAEHRVDAPGRTGVSFRRARAIKRAETFCTDYVECTRTNPPPPSYEEIKYETQGYDWSTPDVPYGSK